MTEATPPSNSRRPVMLILHGTEVEDSEAQAILSGQRGMEASCHYYINAKGDLIHYLDETVRAWHAGRGYWAGFTDINSLSIGIELEAVSSNRRFDGTDTVYTSAQMARLAVLAREIIERHKIAPHHVLAHQDVSCTRPYEPVVAETIEAMGRDYPLGLQKKYDPGPHFNWQDLAAQGVGVWHGLVPVTSDADLVDEGEIARFRMALALYGYDMRGLHDGAVESAIRAFQTRFMPWHISGTVTTQSLAIITRLLDLKQAVSS